jgi:hypothetical protein
MQHRTILLAGRSLHLVKHAGDCAGCENHTAHTVLDIRRLDACELAAAFVGHASDQHELRELAAMDGALHDVYRALDTTIAEKIAWLLETGRLIAVECERQMTAHSDTSRPAATPLPRRQAVTPSRTAVKSEPEKTWVEIMLVDDKMKPVAGQPFVITTPDGARRSGVLDSDGRARVSGIDPGSCDISFPDIDGREWRAL